MKLQKSLKILFTAALALQMCQLAQGQDTIVAWDYIGEGGTTLSVADSIVDAVSTVSPSTETLLGPGLQSRNYLGNGFTASRQDQTTLASAITEDDYISFSIAPKDGKLITVNNISFRPVAEGQERSFSLFSSLDGFTEPEVIGTIVGGVNQGGPMVDIAVSGHDDLMEPVEFRIYIYGNYDNIYQGVGIGNGDGFDLIIEGTAGDLVDNELPSVPDGLVASNITKSSFRLAWNSSTDNYGVTSYDVFMDGSLYENVTDTFINLTGLTPDATLSMQVRAVDLVDNLSDHSTAVDVTLAASNSPDIGTPQDVTVFPGSGTNFAFIPGVTNGGDAGQSLTIGVTSSDNGIILPAGAEFNEHGGYITIEFEERGVMGSAELTVEVSDPEGTVSVSFFVHVAPYTTYGINWSHYDAVFWQENNVLGAEPYYADVLPSANVPGWSEFDYEQIVLSANGGNGCQWSDCYACCMGTVMLSGYIIPPETGNYIFYQTAESDNGLWLSSDESYSNAAIIARKSDEHGDIGVSDNKTMISDFVALEAGKVYAIYGISWPVFHPENFKIEWETPSGTREVIGGENSYFQYDTQKPTVPSALALEAYSSTDVRVTWGESTDDAELKGYNLYVNGVLWNAEPMTSTMATVTGLTPGTDYAFVVSAVDAAGNESGLSSVLEVSTFAEDNTPPDAPENITAVNTAPMALEVGWDAAVDETGIYGYNVYVDGDLYNTEDIILETSVIVSVLDPETTYAIEVEAIDVGENTAKSSPVDLTTTTFDPLADNLGVKTGKLNIEMESVGAFDGFGVNEMTVNTELNRTLLKDLKPREVRWGTLGANPRSLSEFSGTAPYTVADFFSFVIDTLDAAVSFTCGVSEGSDWITDENTFLHFLDYIGGDESTTWGAKRIAEGYPEPFLSRLKHLSFEFGNETWGNASHNVAEDLHGPANYAQWCMEMEELMKTSPYYDADKISFVYSGRNPDPDRSYGINHTLFDEVDTAHMDVIGLGGYISSNVGDGGEVEGEGIVYYRNVFERVANNVNGLKYYNGEMLNRSGEIKKTYFYETDCSANTYFGRVGQAIPVMDHALENIKYGSIYPGLFSLTGGKWAMVNLSENNKRMPKFVLGKFINDYAVGQYLRDTYVTTETIVNGFGTAVDFEPVGTHVFANGTDYTIILNSRDYTSDHYVQINLPDGFSYTASSLKYYVFTGESVDSRDAYIDTVETITDIEDGMIVKVPGYSMVFLSFTGEEFTDIKPLGYVDYIKQQGIEISAETTEINSESPSLPVSATVTPADALGENVYWSISTEDDIQVEFAEFGNWMRINSVSNSGSFTVRGTSLDDPAIFDELEFNANLSGIDEAIGKSLRIYPNPVSNELTVQGEQIIEQVNIFNQTGTLVRQYNVNAMEAQIDMSSFTSGFYIIEVVEKDKTHCKTLIKQ